MSCRLHQYRDGQLRCAVKHIVYEVPCPGLPVLEAIPQQDGNHILPLLQTRGDIVPVIICQMVTVGYVRGQIPLGNALSVHIQLIEAQAAQQYLPLCIRSYHLKAFPEQRCPHML